MFEKFPVSDRVLRWIIDLAASIPGMQVFAGKPQELTVTTGGEIYYIPHPLNQNFPGRAEYLPELFPFPTDASGSFFKYWKSVEKGLKKTGDF
jgi:hypothetical protein